MSIMKMILYDNSFIDIKKSAEGGVFDVVHKKKTRLKGQTTEESLAYKTKTLEKTVNDYAPYVQEIIVNSFCYKNNKYNLFNITKNTKLRYLKKDTPIAELEHRPFEAFGKKIKYFGEISSFDLFSSETVAALPALKLLTKDGSVKYDDSQLLEVQTQWMKFKKFNETVFIAKKPIMHSVSYDFLKNNKLIGETELVLNGQTYVIDLIDSDPAVPLNEWNSLFHSVSSQDRWNWGINYSSQSLGAYLSFSEGLPDFIPEISLEGKQKTGIATITKSTMYGYQINRIKNRIEPIVDVNMNADLKRNAFTVITRGLELLDNSLDYNDTFKTNDHHTNGWRPILRLKKN